MQKSIEWFYSHLNNKALFNKLKNIKIIITDIDGSLTDGNIFLLDHDELKGFSTQDGFAINRAIKAGLLISFISGRNSKAAKTRALKLGIEESLCFFDVPNGKKEIVSKILETKKLGKDVAIFFGDDVLDIDAKDEVGLFVCPSNAPFYIQQASDVVVGLPAGNNAFRLLLDLILYIQKKHPAQKLIEVSLENYHAQNAK